MVWGRLWAKEPAGSAGSCGNTDEGEMWMFFQDCIILDFFLLCIHEAVCVFVFYYLYAACFNSWLRIIWNHSLLSVSVEGESP